MEIILSVEDFPGRGYIKYLANEKNLCNVALWDQPTLKGNNTKCCLVLTQQNGPGYKVRGLQLYFFLCTASA